ncbi:MAG: exonuclease domain-containing protein [Fibrobacterales bacterium]
MITTLSEFIAIDLEATGLDYKNDTIIEIALAHFVDGEVVNSYNKCINPGCLISTFISNLTGITQADLDDAPTFAAEAQEIRKFIGDLPVVAHNSYYDTTMLNTCLEKVSVHLVETNPVFDSLLAARIAWPHLVNHRLGTVIQELDIDVPASHRALPDAIASGKVFIKAQEVFATYSDGVLHQMSQICSSIQLPANKSWSQLFTSPSESQVSSIAVGDSAIHAPLTPEICEKLKNSPLISAATQSLSDKVGISLKGTEVLIAQNDPTFPKCHSYLVPIFERIATSEDRIVISTSKSSRSELIELIKKFEDEIKQPLPYTILQSRDQYLCLQKFANCLKDPDVLLSENEKLTFLTLIPWAHTTVTGDITRHKGFNLSRNRQLWYKLSGAGSSCSGSDCISTYNCFAHRARKQAESAQLIIVDHHGFFTDMQLDFSFIPPYDAILFDDSGDLQSVGYSYLNKSIWYFKLKNIIQTFSSHYEPDVGLYGLLKKHSSLELLPEIEELRELVKGCEKSLHRLFMKLGKNIHKKNSEKRSKISFTQSIGLEFNASPDKLNKAFDTCLTALESIPARLSENDHLFLIKEINEFKTSLSDFYRDIQFVFTSENENFCFWTEEFNNPHKIRMNATAIDPELLIPPKFYQMVRSAIFISNEQTVMGKTSYIRTLFSIENSKKHIRQFVLNREKSLGEVLPIIIATDTHKMPSPQKMSTIISTLQKVMHSSTGKIVVIFQNPYFLRQAYKILSNEAKQGSCKLYAQDIDSGLDNLIPLFISAPHTMLLTTSIYPNLEKVSAEESLTVIYTQLPFPDNQHPALKATSELLEARSINPFTESLVPQTALALEKSLNNLAQLPTPPKVAFLDSRAGAEKYSTVFTNIWNKKHTLYSDSEALLTAIEE